MVAENYNSNLHYVKEQKSLQMIILRTAFDLEQLIQSLVFSFLNGDHQ